MCVWVAHLSSDFRVSVFRTATLGLSPRQSVSFHAILAFRAALCIIIELVIIMIGRRYCRAGTQRHRRTDRKGERRKEKERGFITAGTERE